MNKKIKRLLNSQKTVFYIDTQNYEILHKILSDLGFKGELSEDGFGSRFGQGAYHKDTPHKSEEINYEPFNKKRQIITMNGEIIKFEKGFKLWHDCYSRIRDCPVGQEIAKELINKGLRIAVRDYVDFGLDILITKNDLLLKK